jgi:hypothetical protein
VVVALGLPRDHAAPILVVGVFTDGQAVHDWYTGEKAVVANGKVQFTVAAPVALIAAD